MDIITALSAQIEEFLKSKKALFFAAASTACFLIIATVYLAYSVDDRYIATGFDAIFVEHRLLPTIYFICLIASCLVSLSKVPDRYYIASALVSICWFTFFGVIDRATPDPIACADKPYHELPIIILIVTQLFYTLFIVFPCTWQKPTTQFFLLLNKGVSSKKRATR